MKILSVGVPIVCLMLFSVTVDVGFEKNYDYEEELNRVLNARTELLTQAYYGDKDCLEELEDILMEPLLTQDLEGLEENIDTDIERIAGFEIKDYELLSQDEDGVVIKAVIKWQYENEFNLEEEYDEAQEEVFIGDEYTIIFQYSEDGKLKMSNMFFEAKIFSPYFFEKKRK